MQIWTCEICGQQVEMNSKQRPEGFFENCKLREHMVGDECISRFQLGEAKKFLESKMGESIFHR